METVTIEQKKDLSDYSTYCASCHKEYANYEVGCRVDPYDEKRYCKNCWVRIRMKATSGLIHMKNRD